MVAHLPLPAELVLRLSDWPDELAAFTAARGSRRVGELWGYNVGL